MTLISLIGETNAVEGFEFVYVGPTPDCKNCKVKNACMNLEEGQRYMVLRRREVEHPCKLHDKVCVVEVERIPFDIAVDGRHAEKDTIITVETSTCLRMDCENHSICCPTFFSPGKYRVIGVGDGLVCHLGNDLKAVSVERA
jgi:uncharacterized protein (UPF0179 family)